MRITEHVYAKKMTFQAVTPTGVLERTVYVYLVAGDKSSCLIDTGVFPGVNEVLEFISDSGKKPEDISEILITHGHSDHHGALPSLKRRLQCTAAASELSARWIEDVDLQFRQRPVPHFHDFVEGSAIIERKIRDGNITCLGGSTLVACTAPGHEPGQTAFFHKEDGVLFAADCLPVQGEIPVYDDVSAEVGSIRRLAAIPGVEVLLMSWDDPHIGRGAVQKAFDDAIEYIRKLHGFTLEGIRQYGEANIESVAKYAHQELGLPQETFTKFFLDTVQAHIRERDLMI